MNYLLWSLCFLFLEFIAGVRVLAQTLPEIREEPEESLELDETDVDMSSAEEAPISVSIEPLDVCWIEENSDCTSSSLIITKDTISQIDLTVPSLWWASEQFGGKLLENWLAYPEERRVDLVVNRQRWTLLDYLQRYAFVNQMGTVARSDGYNVRIFNRQEPDMPIATYTCNFSMSLPQCEIEINSGARPNLEDDESGKRSSEEQQIEEGMEEGIEEEVEEQVDGALDGDTNN